MIATAAMLLGTVIEVAELAETALAALVASVGVTFTFSAGIWGLARYDDLRREGRDGAAVLAGAVGALGLLGSAGAVVFGLIVMVNG